MTVSNSSRNDVKKNVLICSMSRGSAPMLFQELILQMSDICNVQTTKIQIGYKTNIRSTWAFLKSGFATSLVLARSDVMIFHCFPAMFVIPIFAAKLFRKKLIMFYWDVSPSTIAGIPYRISILRKLFHQLDNFLVNQVDLNVIPTNDFLPFVGNGSSRTMPLWPQSDIPIQQCKPIAEMKNKNHFNVCFVGHVSEIRGVAQFIDHINSACEQTLTLHIFSEKSASVDTLQSTTKVQVVHHPHLSRDELSREIREMDFGLISLHPNFEQPGFPTKTFDYLAAGIPVLYFGPRLEAYLSPLERCGVAVDIKNMMHIDLALILVELVKSLENGRKEYLNECSLSEQKLADLIMSI